MSKDKFIPKLRFPDFEENGEWVQKRLDKVVTDFIVPMRDKPKKLDGNIPWCRIEDFDGMYLTTSKSNQGVSVQTIKEMNLKVYPVNSLLVSCSADLGRCAITGNELVTNQTFIGLVPDTSKVDVVYLYFIMSNSRNELNARSSGTTISYLSRQEFEKFEIPLPPDQEGDEQRKIASCLSSLDELIAAHNDKLDALKNHKKGLMQNLFPNSLNHDSKGLKDDHDFDAGIKSRNQANQKNQGSDNVPKVRFEEFEGDGEWGMKPLEDVSKITTGNKDTQDKVEDGKYPFFVRSQTIERINSYSFDGEAILTSGDGVGVGKIYHYIIGKFDFHQRVYCIYDFDTDVEGRFIYYFFSEHFYPRVMQLSAKNSVDSVRRAMITEMPIAIPPSKGEQQKIAACLSALDALITAQAEKIEQLQQHKKGLMQGLFPSIKP